MTLRKTIAMATALAALALAPAAQAKGTIYSTGNSNELQAKPIADNGSLGAATTTPTGMVTPRGIAITPDGDYLYMTTAGANVLGFRIGGNTVSQVPGSPYNVTDTGGYGLAITPDGERLYTLNQNGAAGSVSIFTINANGSLTKVGGNATLGYQGDGIAISPTSQNLYITDTTNDRVRSYSIAANGSISQVGTPQATGANPKGIAVGPLGDRVFTASTGGQISSFPVNGNGTITQAATSTVNTGLSPQTLGVTQDGRFLYTADFNTPGRVSGYAIGADGALTAIPGQPFAAQAFAYGLDAAPGGRTVYTTSFDAAVDVPMNGYSVGADGALSALAGSPFATQIFGSEFQSVVVTPNQGPTALWTAAPQGAGQETLFNATGSSDSDGGTVTRYDWDFGDGTTLPDGGPSPTHVYEEQGNYQVTLTVTDNEGCSNVTLFTGQTVDCNATGSAVRSLPVQVGPGTGPELKLKGKKQKLAKKVTVTAKTADETDAVAKGKIRLEKKSGKSQSYKLKQAKKSLDANEKTKLKPKLSNKAYKKAKKALKKGGKVEAKVNVKVTDDDKDTEKDSVKFKLKKKG
jgi:6-phosphogluconolactonase (cycloisomerase 2 family)